MIERIITLSFQIFEGDVDHTHGLGLLHGPIEAMRQAIYEKLHINWINGQWEVTNPIDDPERHWVGHADIQTLAILDYLRARQGILEAETPLLSKQIAFWTIEPASENKPDIPAQLCELDALNATLGDPGSADFDLAAWKKTLQKVDDLITQIEAACPGFEVVKVDVSNTKFNVDGATLRYALVPAEDQASKK